MPIDTPAPVSVAPMLEWTDRHFRYFVRRISRHALLYTEMLTTSALIHGDRQRLLQYDPAEKPLALQLAGCEPADLAWCARIVADQGFDAINLNVGCPSDRVQQARFGACLMAEPERVAECVAAMREVVGIPVTVKTRIGIDERDSYEHLVDFVSKVAAGGCNTFIIHARKAWLKGLSPRENRDIPPLKYDVAAAIKRDFPHLCIILNGGIVDLDQAERELKRFDGVMIGRAAYHNPYLLAGVDSRFHADDRPVSSRHEVIQSLLPYVEQQLQGGERLHNMTRHLLGLYHGQPGGRAFRRHLSERAGRYPGGTALLLEAARFCGLEG
ncbi:tRNA dihydrouridine(20/20a) synthase DusA [Candidatus Woesearchaeota archaeon]|nr:tRNA dihydrouridine(20/20a) synthase DusA [Candidatus Woesearchaeota archaeon]